MKMTTLKLFLGLATTVFAGQALAAEPAFKVYGTTVSMDEVAKDKQGDFFEIEKKKYDLVEGMAFERYLQAFWEKKATESKVSVAEARRAYMEKNVKVSDKEVKEMVQKYEGQSMLSMQPD